MLGAIADDFTGATDLAGNWRSRGLSTAVVLGVPEADGLDALRTHAAVVIALKIRSVPAEEAVATVREAAAVLRELGCTQVYDKYCSTFDSTPEGNIGPIADALLEETGARTAVVVPGFPDAGRTVYKGHLFVGNDPLDRSSMRDHPLNPMWDSRVSTLLAAQTSHAVAEVHIDVVRRGSAALRAAIDAADARGARYVVVDSIDGADLRTIATATGGDPLVTGGSGLALGVEAKQVAPSDLAAIPGRRVVLAGSASTATQAQVQDARRTMSSRKLDVRTLVDDMAGEEQRLLDWFVERWADDPDRPVMLYSVGDARDVAAGRAASPRASELIETLYSRLAPRLADAGASQFIVAGGETSGSVAQGLGVSVLEVGQLLSPGVSWLRARRRSAPELNLVLKSGNFGDVDLFSSAWERLA
ncbi:MULTISPECIES: 3-oxo-tetronate kinase [unclassified Pseudoclavibacter]|uniref:3-oxo-tetronate kinase n=1 Tax=unclassified Pseudoclavibacter TaxID=2615177 RepID=UPI001BA80C9A|nr:3-oxo-tetronate kinase [Pseudoclavibacter sp. Marseille-Q4354]MBS3179313.1 four-carbon acid sugar kinase family protein [Pseudoclavibacter sp. Marseille-Q4354]